MDKKLESYKKIKNSIQYIMNSIERERETLQEHAPEDLLKKVVESYNFLKKFDVESLCPTPEVKTGDFFDFETIKETIFHHTGYIWKIKELSIPEMSELNLSPKKFEQMFNYSISDYKVYEFFRHSDNRSDLYLLLLVLLPGCAYIQYNTGRVSGDTDVCDSPENLMKSFINHCG